MKKTITTILMVFFLASTLLGCSGNTEVPENSPENDGITIACVYNQSLRIEEVAKQFEEETGIRVNVKMYDDRTQYNEQLKTELLAQIGADIVDVGGINFNEFGANELLYDFAPLIGNDDILNEETIMTQIFDEKSVYAVPLGFSLEVLVARSPEIAAQAREKQQYTWPEFIEWAKEFQNGKWLTRILDSDIFSLWLTDRMDEMLDESNTEAPLNEDMLREILESIKIWKEENVCYSYQDLVNANNTEMEELDKAAFLYQPVNNSEYLLLQDANIRIQQDEFAFYEIPMPTEEAANYRYPITYLEAFGISKSSQNQEDALEFLKYMITHTEELCTDGYLIPINLKACENKIRENLKKLQDDGYFETEIDVEECTAQILERLGNMKFDMGLNDIISETIQEEATKYFNGEQDVNNAIDKIEHAVSLQLMERRQ